MNIYICQTGSNAVLTRMYFSNSQDIKDNKKIAMQDIPQFLT